MPTISFTDLDRQFRENAQDRAITVPGTGTNPNATVVAAERLETSGTRAGTISGFNSNAFDASRMRLPNAGFQPGNVRVGFVLTSDLWIQENRALQLHAGPKDVTWNFKLRASDVETKSGHARFAQNRRLEDGNEAYFAFPEANFNFQTGNIMPIETFQNQVEIAHGLRDFYLFHELLNQPPILPNGANEGSHNYTWIFYTSLAYPQILLKGYFTPEGISMNDSSDQPSHFDWSSNFIVHEMSPNIFDSGEMETAYIDFMTETARSF